MPGVQDIERAVGENKLLARRAQARAFSPACPIAPQSWIRHFAQGKLTTEDAEVHRGKLTARLDPLRPPWFKFLHLRDDRVAEGGALDLGRAFHQAGEVVGHLLRRRSRRPCP
jgi:hypothetical protein